MQDEPRGLRERKKLQQRQHIADTAAALFASHGYDETSVTDVARTAGVSTQTVYNYFPTKPDLVLDRAEQFRQLYDRTVRQRPAGTSPAAALHPLMGQDIDRYRRSDTGQARGEFPALSLRSPQLRRVTLEFRAAQLDTVAHAITDTSPALNPLVVTAHAAALIWTVHALTDRIGAAILADDVSEVTAERMQTDLEAALGDLDRHFLALTGRAAGRGS